MTSEDWTRLIKDEKTKRDRAWEKLYSEEERRAQLLHFFEWAKSMTRDASVREKLRIDFANRRVYIQEEPTTQ